MSDLAAMRQQLERIQARVRQNVPQSGRPERFHEEKSEIANDLGKIIRELPER